MKKLNNILLLITILGFLLPFLPPSCSKKKEETSIFKTNIVDTNYVVANENESLTDSTTNKIDKVTQQISDTTTTTKFTLLERLFVYPDNENLSGFGYIYTLFEKEYFTIFFSFSLLWIVLLNRLTNFKIIAFDNTYILTAGLCLLIILGIFDSDKVKFGFWVTSGLYFMAVIMFYAETKQKSNT